MGPRNYVETEMVEGKELWTYKFIREYEDIPDRYDKIWELKKIWDFKYRSLKKSHKNKIDTIMSYGKKNLGKKKLTFKGLKPTIFKRELLYNLEQNNLSYPVQCLMVNDKYYDCDFTEEHLDEIVDFVNNHRRLSGLLSRTNNVQEQYNNIKMIKTLAKQEGQWIIGELETLGLEEMIRGSVITKEWVEGLIEKEKQRISTPLVEPINISNFKYKECVTELTKPIELKLEGEKMGHCVGGYSYNVERGESRIFHIEVDGINSTLEIGLIDYGNNMDYELDTLENRKKIDRKKKFAIKQHYGRYPEKLGNQVPTNKCRGVGMKLVYHLAKQELSDDEFKELFELKDINTHFKQNKKNNGWSVNLNDRHRGRNNPNKKRKKKNGGLFDYYL